MAANPPLPRVTEQEIRNNLARTLRANFDAEPNLAWEVDEYFQMWGDGAFPWVNGGILTLHPNSALSEEERQALIPLVRVLNEAWTLTGDMSPAEFLHTEWPSRIVQLAQETYAIMSARGCLSETVEEVEPSALF